MQSTSAKYLPKLTQNQKRLLRRHDGCLKCRCFYVDHDTDNCKNNYPNPYALLPLTEEAAVAARASRDRDMNRDTLSDGGHFGVTPPISPSESNEREKKATNTLINELRGQYLNEDAAETRKREIVLQRVAAFVKKFVWTVSVTRGLSEAMANVAGGRIFISGLSGLGIQSPGDDLDILCVVPKHVSRDDFFTVFKRMLRKVKGVSGILGMPDAFVPGIKAKISGIPLNISIACLALSSIPDDLPLDDDLLQNLDEKCVRSMNGPRVIAEILRLVPSVRVFQDSLRCIKLWAQRQVIHSSVNGFLDGVTWGILVARVCQLYPNAVAGTVVSRFFVIMYQWVWPQPVFLKQIKDGPLQLPVWNPKLHPAELAHRMPIITPAYPATCASQNVTALTQMVMIEELKKAAVIVDKVIIGMAEWSGLFEQHGFFHKYRYYIQVTTSSDNVASQIQWSGTVESRMRQFVLMLEHVDSLTLAHPFSEGFEKVSYCISDDEVCAVAQGENWESINKRKEEDIKGKAVYSTTFYIGLAANNSSDNGPQKIDTSYPAAEFTKMLKMWEKFDETTMEISVRQIKRFHSSMPCSLSHCCQGQVEGSDTSKLRAPEGAKSNYSQNSSFTQRRHTVGS